MGRPRKPLEQLRLAGTERKSRTAARAAELMVAGGDIGPAPEWLGEIGRLEWEALTTHPQYSQVLSAVHRSALIEYCALHETMIRSSKGECIMRATERKALDSLRTALGITPASQSKIKMPAPEPPQTKWAATKPIRILAGGTGQAREPAALAPEHLGGKETP